jgi:hypothetical protein
VKRAVAFCVVGVVAGSLAVGCGETKTVTETVTTTVTTEANSGVGAPEERVEFGYIKSLERKGSGYELRFDPAWFLSGETASAAAAEDGAVEPGEPVPNDNYVVDEGHRVLTYTVPADARVTVLTASPDGTPISVEELAQIIAGKHKPLWEPITTGFWLRADIDTVRSLDQQYRP